MDDCEAAIARDPSYAKAHVRLGQAHGSLGDWAAAVGCYTRAAALEPDNATTAVALKSAKAKVLRPNRLAQLDPHTRLPMTGGKVPL